MASEPTPPAELLAAAEARIARLEAMLEVACDRLCAIGAIAARAWPPAVHGYRRIVELAGRSLVPVPPAAAPASETARRALPNEHGPHNCADCKDLDSHPVVHVRCDTWWRYRRAGAELGAPMLRGILAAAEPVLLAARRAVAWAIDGQAPPLALILGPGSVAAGACAARECASATNAKRVALFGGSAFRPLFEESDCNGLVHVDDAEALKYGAYDLVVVLRANACTERVFVNALFATRARGGKVLLLAEAAPNARSANWFLRLHGLAGLGLEDVRVFVLPFREAVAEWWRQCPTCGGPGLSSCDAEALCETCGPWYPPAPPSARKETHDEG